MRNESANHEKRKNQQMIEQEKFEKLVKLNSKLALKMDAEAITIESCETMPNEGAENLLSNDKNKMCAESRFESDEMWFVTMKFKQPIFMRGYTLQTANDFPQRDPRCWEIKAKKVNILTSEEAEDY